MKKAFSISALALVVSFWLCIISYRAIAQDIGSVIALPDTPFVIPVPNHSYVFPDYRTADVLTQRNDNNRTGASYVAGINQHSVARFERLGAFNVDGVVLAQPLYAHSAVVTNIRQPVLIVATSNNDVYAFSPTERAAQWLWHNRLGRPLVAGGGRAACEQPDLAAWQDWGTLAPGVPNGIFGIEATPVIDAAQNRVFVSFKTEDSVQHLAALDLNDGHVIKSVVVPGPNAEWHKLHQNRASLLLSDSIVFVGFSALCEGNAARMHGSISAFDATTLEPVGRFQVTDDGTDGGGIWQGSTGLAADTRGNLYFTTGNRRLCGVVPNGETNSADKPNLANSVIRLKTMRLSRDNAPARPGEPYRLSMEPEDYFTPYRRIMEDCNDLDLSAAGVLLIPGTYYLGAGGKEGVFYVLDRANMGHYDNPGTAWNLDSVINVHNRAKHKDAPDDPSFDSVHQKFQATAVRYPDGMDYLLSDWIKWPHIHGTPAFARFGSDEFMFLWGEKDRLKRFRWRDGKFELPPLERDPIAPPYISDSLNGMPGGMVSVNVDPSGVGLGVVFASVKTCNEPSYPPCTVERPTGADPRESGFGQSFGILRAYDPFTMLQVWNNRDEPEKYKFAKLVPPTIANGRVFLATASGKVLIYGP
jgi:hypothetical protein